jgi:small subunit ribosomal protein S2e
MADKEKFGKGFGDKKASERKGKKAAGKKAPRAPIIEDWQPITKLGRLVANGVITNIDEIYMHSIPIKEPQIVDYLFKGKAVLKEEVMRIASVQKQTAAGQRTRFKAIVLLGDECGHIGLGQKLAKEVQFAIKGAIADAKINLIPVRRGYWGEKLGQPQTINCKVTGKSGSVSVKLIPAPRGSGIVGAPITKKILVLSGIKDCFTSARGHTKTGENFLKATFNALKESYAILTPDLWGDHAIPQNLLEKYTNDMKGKSVKLGEEAKH